MEKEESPYAYPEKELSVGGHGYGGDGRDESSIIDGEVVPDPDAGLSDAERAKAHRALLWKLDLRLVPWLSLLYLASFLDRTSAPLQCLEARADGRAQGRTSATRNSPASPRASTCRPTARSSTRR